MGNFLLEVGKKPEMGRAGGEGRVGFMTGEMGNF